MGKDQKQKSTIAYPFFLYFVKEHSFCYKKKNMLGTTRDT